MTLAELRAILAATACVALASPALAQDEADEADEDAEETVEIAPDAPFLRLAEPPPAGEASFATPGGLEVILMSDAELRAAVAPIEQGFRTCEARLQEFETMLATLPDEIEAVYPRHPPPAEEDPEAGLDEEEEEVSLGDGGPPTSLFEDDEALDSGDEAEESEDGEAADGEAAEGEEAAEEPVEEEVVFSFYGLREVYDDAEIHPDTAEEFDILDHPEATSRTVFGVENGWAEGIVSCVLDADVALGHLEREAGRRGLTLPAAESLSERVAEFDNEAREYLPPPPPAPEPPPSAEDAAAAAECEPAEVVECAEGEECEAVEVSEGEDGAEGEDVAAETCAAEVAEGEDGEEGEAEEGEGDDE